MSDSNLMRRQANAIYLEVSESAADDVAKSLRAGADAFDRLQRAEELRNKWERHANAIPEADCVDSDYRQGFKDALMACVQDYDDTLGESRDTD